MVSARGRLVCLFCFHSRMIVCIHLYVCVCVCVCVCWGVLVYMGALIFLSYVLKRLCVVVGGGVSC